MSIAEFQRFYGARVEFARGRRGRPFFRIHIPQYLDLAENYLEFLSLLELIGRARQQRLIMYFDFSALERIDEGAALMLAAEIDTVDWLRRQKAGPRKKDQRWHPNVEQALLQFGFFDLLNVSNPPPPCAEVDAKRYVRFITDRRADGAHADQLRKSLASQIDGENGEQTPSVLKISQDPTQRQKFYAALIEAMGNVANHAYVLGSEFDNTEIFGRWWMGGSYDPVNKEFTAVFYDKGQGIPRSLQAQTALERLQRTMKRIGVKGYDGFMIQAAMGLGRSRTGQRNRGKGLPQMRRMIADDQPGQMTIISGRGRYDYIRPAPNGRNKGTYFDLERPLNGTFILWKVQVPE